VHRRTRRDAPAHCLARTTTIRHPDDGREQLCSARQGLPSRVPCVGIAPPPAANQFRQPPSGRYGTPQQPRASVPGGLVPPPALRGAVRWLENGLLRRTPQSTQASGRRGEARSHAAPPTYLIDQRDPIRRRVRLAPTRQRAYRRLPTCHEDLTTAPLPHVNWRPSALCLAVRTVAAAPWSPTNAWTLRVAHGLKTSGWRVRDPR
jgi:hypothetical protein